MGQLGKLECFLIRKAGSTTTLNGSDSKDRELRLPSGPSTTQTWPFVEVYCNKRYFYLEAQSYIIDGHPELFLWLWFLGNNKTLKKKKSCTAFKNNLVLERGKIITRNNPPYSTVSLLYSAVGYRVPIVLTLIKSRTCADIHVSVPISVLAQPDWFNSTDSGGQYYLRKTSTQTELDMICYIRLRPGGNTLQIPPDRHTRQVRVFLQGTRHKSHAVC